MFPTTEYNISLTKGDSYQSEAFFFINENIPSYLSIDEIDAGLTSGLYTKFDLSNFTPKGQVRADFTDVKVSDLVVTVADNELTFDIDKQDFDQMPNEERTLVYDVQLTDQGGNNYTVIKGQINIVPEVTSEAL